MPRRPDFSTSIQGEQFLPPPGLSRRALEIWNEIAPLVPNAARAQALGLGDFCWCMAELERVRAEVVEQGPTVPGGRGTEKKNPLMQRERELRQAVQRYINDFALTPVSAHRVVGQSESKNSGDEFMDGNWSPGEDGKVVH